MAYMAVACFFVKEILQCNKLGNMPSATQLKA